MCQMFLIVFFFPSPLLLLLLLLLPMLGIVFKELAAFVPKYVLWRAEVGTGQ